MIYEKQTSCLQARPYIKKLNIGCSCAYNSPAKYDVISNTGHFGGIGFCQSFQPAYLTHQRQPIKARLTLHSNVNKPSLGPLVDMFKHV